MSAWPNRSRISLSSPFQESLNTERSNPKVKTGKTKTKSDHSVIVNDQSDNEFETNLAEIQE